MANTITSVVVFEGTPDDVTALLSRAARPLSPRFPELDEEPNWRILFNLYPIPADVPDAHEDGVAWPDKHWMQNHWGTERLLGGGELRRETATRGRIELLTAYDYPVGWVDQVAADYPSLTFRHSGEVEMMDEAYFAVYRQGRRVRQWQAGRGGRLSHAEQLELYTRTGVLGLVVKAANTLTRKLPTPDVLIQRAEAVGRILEKWPESAAEDGYRAEQVLDDLNRAVELDTTPAGYVARGRYHQKAGGLEAARTDFDAAIRLDPTNVDALAARAEFSLDQNDSRRALIDANRAMRLHPDHPAGYEQCVQAHVRRDNLPAAVRMADRWRQIDPGHDRVYHWRAVAHFNADRHELALRDLEEANRWNPVLDWLAGWNRLRADCLFSLGRHKEAIEVCDHGLRWAKSEPDDAANLHFTRGRALYAMKKWGMAIAAYNRALRLRPGHRAAVQWRFLPRAFQKDYATAEAELIRDGGDWATEFLASLGGKQRKR